MKKLDKKQVPQVIILAVLACAVFGWFAYRMIKPTPASASSQAAAASMTVASAPASDGAASPAAPADQSAPVVPPGPGLRDPFVQAISSTPASVPAPAKAPAVPAAPAVSALKPVKVASLPPLVPVVPALPSSAASNGVRETPPAPAAAPAPVVIPPPAWTVTGVLASGNEHVAILRSGEARRFVKKGDALDGLFKVIAVTSDTVILRHGSSHYVLPLGGGKAAAPAAAPVSPRPASPPADLTLAPPLRAVRIAQAPRVRPVPVAQAPRVQAVAKPRRLTVMSTARKAIRRALCAIGLYETPAPAPRRQPSPVSRLLPVGALAPDFSLQTLDGGAQSLSQHRGQVVLLHFWSSWDPACQSGLPLLTQMGSNYSPQGLAVLSVNSWDNTTALRPFLRRQGLNAASVLYDPSVANESVAVRLYNASDVSTTYVITPNGDVAARFVGYSPKTIADIRRVLASLGVS